ncbi:MAG TPA: putative inorganic carbon transporter subunit DabA [Polyangia bacterium]
MHAPHAPAAVGSELDLDQMLSRVARWLPTQGPLKDFVHHNPLHAFEHLKFHDALGCAARLYGARTAMPGRFYWEAFSAGQIREPALSRAIARAFADESERARARARLLAGPIEAPLFSGRARSGLRAAWQARLGGVRLERRSHLHLFRLIGAYLDQGLAIWRMPEAEELDFFQAVSALAQKSALPLRPFDAPLARALIVLPAREALASALERTVGRVELYESYLLETLLAQPGWAGMVGECERKPELLLGRRRIHLLDYAAVTLAAELGCLEEELGASFAPLGQQLDLAQAPSPDDKFTPTEDQRLLSIWHDAFEWSYYEPLLGALSAPHPQPAPAPAPASAWALFCLDDRSSSLRRHLEEAAPRVATFGTAGFFGLDFVYCGAGDAIASKHCPAPMVARHLVVESYEAEARPAPASAPWWRRPAHLEAQSNTLVRGWLLSYTLGLGAAVRLAASVFRPSLAPVTVPPLSTVSGGARFKLVREGDARSPDGLWLGYTVSELADRVQELFHSIGAGDHFPELVVLYGHGASSVNNPYFAAYNCGACSGRSGAPNARAFAKAANRPDVRAALAARGLEIPEITWFVGALYDTTRDEPTYYDLHRMPGSFHPAFEEFRRAMDAAAARNAAERCRRFETLPPDLSPARALAQVRQRSVSLFEPRPEYNHATNAACVVGRRALSADLFLDRRVFLSSYDPTRDPNGAILAALLASVVPVCAGINLEYFFSRLDPLRYGAGTKLPHNVNGLLGVCNGIEGDLLTGLPTQMTEIHDPVRLLTVVEQTPEVALAAVRHNPAIFSLIENEWVIYACVDPESRQVSLYRDGRLRRLDGLAAPTARFPSALDAAGQGRGPLPVSFLDRVDSAKR